MKKILTVLAIGGMLSSCGVLRPETSSGVVDAGRSEFLTSRTGSSFAPIGELKASAMRDASEHCRYAQKSMQVLGVKETPMSFGIYPQVEVTFTCK